MNYIKRICTLIMVLAMVLSLAVPAMAADEGKFDITIKQEFSATHTYEAYQIFSGELYGDVLSNIQWGEGVNGPAIITALKANDTTNTVFAEANIAQQVADLLSTHSTNTALIHAFRHIVAENLTETYHISTGPVDGTYTIANVEPGYYFIKDKNGSLDETNETYTNYILEIVGETNITPKGGRVIHDKLIEDGGNRVEAADYSIGDTVKFVLRGSLPENYAVFSKYAYSFVDTLSEGLTFNKDVKVYLENAGTKTELTTGFEVNVGENATAKGASFTVDFADLKAIKDRTIDDHTTIIVEYTATLNDKAEIGAPGNKNESYIIFDNDPHSDEKGETPKDYVFVFTWELDVDKIDGKTEAGLANAKFVLYRELSGTKQYVKLDSDHKVTGWVSGTVDESGADVIPADATTLVSDQNGDFVIIGLEADRYYLKETDAPDGYHLLENVINIDIRAEVTESEDGTTGVVTRLEIKVDSNPIADGDKETGVVAMEVINNPGATLPETGGMGTTLFYVFGGLMVAAAVVLLVTKKRMSYEG